MSISSQSKGAHDSTQAYDADDIVTGFDSLGVKGLYVALQAVPINTALSNTDYWELIYSAPQKFVRFGMDVDYKGQWNNDQSWLKSDYVYDIDENGWYQYYVALADVPSGVALSMTAYWKKVATSVSYATITALIKDLSVYSTLETTFGFPQGSIRNFETGISLDDVKGLYQDNGTESILWIFNREPTGTLSSLLVNDNGTVTATTEESEEYTLISSTSYLNSKFGVSGDAGAVEHDETQTWDLGDRVYVTDSNGYTQYYVALQYVPANTDIGDTDYWQNTGFSISYDSLVSTIISQLAETLAYDAATEYDEETAYTKGQTVYVDGSDFYRRVYLASDEIEAATPVTNAVWVLLSENLIPSKLEEYVAQSKIDASFAASGTYDSESDYDAFATVGVTDSDGVELVYMAKQAVLASEEIDISNTDYWALISSYVPLDTIQSILSTRSVINTIAAIINIQSSQIVELDDGIQVNNYQGYYQTDENKIWLPMNDDDTITGLFNSVVDNGDGTALLNTSTGSFDICSYKTKTLLTNFEIFENAGVAIWPKSPNLSAVVGDTITKDVAYLCINGQLYHLSTTGVQGSIDALDVDNLTVTIGGTAYTMKHTVLNMEDDNLGNISDGVKFTTTNEYGVADDGTLWCIGSASSLPYTTSAGDPTTIEENGILVEYQNITAKNLEEYSGELLNDSQLQLIKGTTYPPHLSHNADTETYNTPANANRLRYNDGLFDITDSNGDVVVVSGTIESISESSVVISSTTYKLREVDLSPVIASTVEVLKNIDPKFTGQVAHLKKYATTNLGGGELTGFVDDVIYPTDGTTNLVSGDTIPTGTTVVLYSSVKYYLSKPVEVGGTVSSLSLSSYGLLNLKINDGSSDIQYRGVSEENEGLFFVTTGGFRWMRELKSYIDLADFGLQYAGSIDAVLDAAVSVAQAHSCVSIKIPQPIPSTAAYTIDAAHVYDLSNGDDGFEISAYTIWGGNGVPISQTVDDVALWFIRTGSGLFYGATVRGLHASFTGDTDTQAQFVRMSDAWGYLIEDCAFNAYASTHPVHFYNLTYWTEHARMRNCMSRYCLGLVKFTQSGNAYSSFYGSEIVDCWCQYAVANGSGILVGDGTNEVICYCGKWSLGGWFESGGGHHHVVALDYATINQTIDLHPDGISSSDGNSLQWIYKSGLNGYVKVSGSGGSGEFVYDGSSLADGSSSRVARIIHGSTSAYTVMSDNVPAPVIAAGYKIAIEFIDNNSDKTITLDWLHTNTRWRMSYYLNGELINSYRVNCKTVNHTPHIVSEMWSDSAPLQASDNFKLEAYSGDNDGFGGSYMANGQGKVDIVMLSGTAGTTDTIKVVLEMVGE